MFQWQFNRLPLTCFISVGGRGGDCCRQADKNGSTRSCSVGSLDTPSECLYGRNLGFLKKIAYTSSTHIAYVELILSLLFRALPALAWARVKNFAVELAGLVLLVECFLSLKNCIDKFYLTYVLKTS